MRTSLTAAGTALLALAASALPALATPGDLQVANHNNNTIERFTPGGIPSVFASTGLNGPTFLAFEPGAAPATVPEPASAALLAFGVAGVAGVAGVDALRRRHGWASAAIQRRPPGVVRPAPCRGLANPAQPIISISIKYRSRNDAG